MIFKVRKEIALLLASALLVLFASLGWACTTSATIRLATPPVGRQNSTVTLEGGNFQPGIVEVRWGSSAGPVLAAVQGPEFSTSFQIPSSKPDVYFIVAVNKPEQGQFAGKAAVSFEIVDSGGRAMSNKTSQTSSDLWKGFSEKAGESQDVVGRPASSAGRSTKAAGVSLLWAGGMALAVGIVSPMVLRRRRKTT